MFIYPPLYRKLRRGPQVILPKDIGAIIAFSGVSRESVCVDAGLGSGWLALSLARICKFVYAYELRSEFIEIAERNRRTLGIENIEFKNKDIFKGIDERMVDFISLDLPSPEKALRHCKKALKKDGVVAGYSPNTEQVAAFAKKLDKLGFSDRYTIEVIAREIMVRDQGVRPTTKGIWHTGYITFAILR